MLMTDDTKVADVTESDEDDEEEFDYAPVVPEAPPQVPSYIAIIRIVAVLGMGLSISFGLFLSLFGVKGMVVGIPLMLLAIPCYYGMRLAERLVGPDDDAAADAA
jgi:hypothetical protein